MQQGASRMTEMLKKITAKEAGQKCRTYNGMKQNKIQVVLILLLNFHLPINLPTYKTHIWHFSLSCTFVQFYEAWCQQHLPCLRQAYHLVSIICNYRIWECIQCIQTCIHYLKTYTILLFFSNRIYRVPIMNWNLGIRWWEKTISFLKFSWGRQTLLNHQLNVKIPSNITTSRARTLRQINSYNTHKRPMRKILSTFYWSGNWGRKSHYFP